MLFLEITFTLKELIYQKCLILSRQKGVCIISEPFNRNEITPSFSYQCLIIVGFKIWLSDILKFCNKFLYVIWSTLIENHLPFFTFIFSVIVIVFVLDFFSLSWNIDTKSRSEWNCFKVNVECSIHCKRIIYKGSLILIVFTASVVLFRM